MKDLTFKLADVQTKMKAKKSSYNKFGKYYFRKAEDILEAVKPFLLQHKIYVTISEEIVATDPVPIMQATATFSDGENAIHATSIVGVDLNQKGMNVPQQFGSASSYAKKYALGNLFLIDDTADSDATNDHSKKPRFEAKKPALSNLKVNGKPSEAFTKAKDYVKAGGKIDAIKTKYALSKEAEQELTTL